MSKERIERRKLWLQMTAGVRISLLLLDGRKVEMTVSPRMHTRDLLTMAATHIGDINLRFFSLCHISENGSISWLSSDRRLLEHDSLRSMGTKMVTICFMVKFYPNSISELKAASEIELFYQHSRQLLAKDKLTVESCAAFHLAALSLQASYGDFVDTSLTHSQLKKSALLPSSVLLQHPSLVYCEEQVACQHKGLTGLSRGDAIISFLKEVEKLPGYGVHLYEVRDRTDLPWYLGISNRGIATYDYIDKRKPKKVFLWRQLENIYFRERKFSIEVHDPKRVYVSRRSLGSQSAASLFIHIWFAESQSACKAIWSMAIAQHQFYLDRKAYTSEEKPLVDMPEVALELSRSCLSLSTHSSCSNLSHSRTNSHSSLHDSRTEIGSSESLELARQEMLEALRQRKEALDEKLKDKTQELRLLCLREGELTGELPPEYPVIPGQPPPTVRKRMGTSFALDESIINRIINKQEETVSALELEYEIMAKITSAAFKLANESTARKGVRRQRKLSYQQSAHRLRDIESRLKLARGKVVSSANTLPKQKKKPRPASESEGFEDGSLTSSAQESPLTPLMVTPRGRDSTLPPIAQRGRASAPASPHRRGGNGAHPPHNSSPNKNLSAGYIPSSVYTCSQYRSLHFPTLSTRYKKDKPNSILISSDSFLTNNLQASHYPNPLSKACRFHSSSIDQIDCLSNESSSGFSSIKSSSDIDDMNDLKLASSAGDLSISNLDTCDHIMLLRAPLAKEERHFTPRQSISSLSGLSDDESTPYRNVNPFSRASNVRKTLCAAPTMMRTSRSMPRELVDPSCLSYEARLSQDPLNLCINSDTVSFPGGLYNLQHQQHKSSNGSSKSNSVGVSFHHPHHSNHLPHPHSNRRLDSQNSLHKAERYPNAHTPKPIDQNIIQHNLVSSSDLNDMSYDIHKQRNLSQSTLRGYGYNMQQGARVPYHHSQSHDTSNHSYQYPTNPYSTSSNNFHNTTTASIDSTEGGRNPHNLSTMSYTPQSSQPHFSAPQVMRSMSTSNAVHPYQRGASMDPNQRPQLHQLAQPRQSHNKSVSNESGEDLYMNMNKCNQDETRLPYQNGDSVDGVNPEELENFIRQSNSNMQSVYHQQQKLFPGKNFNPEENKSVEHSIPRSVSGGRKYLETSFLGDSSSASSTTSNQENIPPPLRATHAHQSMPMHNTPTLIPLRPTGGSNNLRASSSITPADMAPPRLIPAADLTPLRAVKSSSELPPLRASVSRYDNPPHQNAKTNNTPKQPQEPPLMSLAEAARQKKDNNNVTKEWYETCLDSPVTSRGSSSEKSAGLDTSFNNSNDVIPHVVPKGPTGEDLIYRDINDNSTVKEGESPSPVGSSVVITAGSYTPSREETKPFEMSDFYKYSTRFRKQSSNNSSFSTTDSPVLPPRAQVVVSSSKTAPPSPQVVAQHSTPTPQQKGVYQSLTPYACKEIENGEVNAGWEREQLHQAVPATVTNAKRSATLV